MASRVDEHSAADEALAVVLDAQHAASAHGGHVASPPSVVHRVLPHHVSERVPLRRALGGHLQHVVAPLESGSGLVVWTAGERVRAGHEGEAQRRRARGEPRRRRVDRQGQREDLAGLDQPGRGHALLGADQVLGAALVVLAPAPPVVGLTGLVAAHHLALLVDRVGRRFPLVAVLARLQPSHDRSFVSNKRLVGAPYRE